MSSHHFVRDGQEPALFIADPAFDGELNALLEWAPYITVASGSVTKLILAGTKIDTVIVGSEETQEHLQELLAGQVVKLIVPMIGKSAAVAALEHLIQRRETGVNILSSSPETIFDDTRTFAGKIQVNVFIGRTKWSLIHRRDFEKWYPGGTHLQVRMTDPGQRIEFQGLRPTNDWFEVVTSGLVRILSEHQFWVGETY